jgi:hypothetical protein
MAHRWGETTEHSYLLGWEDDLEKAKIIAKEEWDIKVKDSRKIYRENPDNQDTKELIRKFNTNTMFKIDVNRISKKVVNKTIIGKLKAQEK